MHTFQSMDLTSLSAGLKGHDEKWCLVPQHSDSEYNCCHQYHLVPGGKGEVERNFQDFVFSCRNVCTIV
jgi:hypothetical protein